MGNRWKWMRVLKDGSCRGSRCKQGDRSFGGVVIAERKQTGIRWEEEKRVGESPPSQTLSRHGTILPWKKNEEGKKGKDEEGRGGGGVAPALLLTRVVIV
jgi:hypothetical protein